VQQIGQLVELEHIVVEVHLDVQDVQMHTIVQDQLINKHVHLDQLQMQILHLEKIVTLQQLHHNILRQQKLVV
jgi:hypothetical protein